MPLTPEQLARLQARMEERVAALAAEIRQDAGRSREDTYGTLAGPASDIGDEAVADLISDLDHAELSRDLQELRQLEAAQDRLAQGNYGSCVDCGREIDFDRLLAQPSALRCLDCQAVHERTHAHAAESKL